MAYATVTSANLEKITEDIGCIKENVEKLVEFNYNVVERSRISKPSPNIKNVEIMNEEMETLDATVCLARSLKDIESVGFTYNEEKEELRCSVCTTTEGSHMNHANNTNNFSANGIFKYESQVTGVSFSPDQCLPEKFRNLKKHVGRRIKLSASHVQNLRSQMEKRKEIEKVKTKNYEAGMNIGRTCYKLFLKGCPFSDYEEDILVLKQAKANVGQLNHSRKFPSAFLPHVVKEVESRIKKFLTSKLQQTRGVLARVETMRTRCGPLAL